MMVSPAVAVNGTAPSDGLPAGNYTMIGWDMDTTGRRLIDEICHIGAYTPTSQFSQYIMPHGNLNPGARRRHNIRVVTIGRYRMLKDNVSNKVLKTKSEISALVEFLDWLEAQKGEGSTGVILVIHEPRKVTSPMLLEALRRYNLVDRFKSIVVGFADGQALAADKCRTTVKSFSLRVLARVLLDADWALDSAAERATAAYKVAHHLSQGEQQDLVAGKGEASVASLENMCEVVRGFTVSTEKELADLVQLKSLLDRQNTFRPVFGPLLIRTSREERLRAATLRRLLAEAQLDYQRLKSVWEESKLTGLEEELACLSVSANEEQLKELVEILDCHFDPAKEAKGPKPRPIRTKAVRSGVDKQASGDGEGEEKVDAEGNGDQNADESGSTSPDTTSSGSPAKVKSEEIDTGLSQNDTQSTTTLPQAAAAN